MNDFEIYVGVTELLATNNLEINFSRLYVCDALGVFGIGLSVEKSLIQLGIKNPFIRLG